MAAVREAAGGIDAFCHTWRLRPAESRYEHGTPPREAVYRIERDHEWLLFAARWVDAHGRRLEMSFAGIPDGRQYTYDDPDVADTLTTTLVDPRTLETVIEIRNRVVGTGRRVLSEDGKTMRMTQTGSTPDGRAFTNLSVYARE